MRHHGTRIDLVAPGDLERLEKRHLDDSLKALALVEGAPAGPAIDVGSGAGLPGVPLAIAGPRRWWRLLEPRSRRAAFLDEVVRELDLNAEVVRKSSQEAAGDPTLAAAHAVATARAVAEPSRAFALMEPLLAPAGIRVVWLGRNAVTPPGSERRAEGLAIMR